MRPLAVGRLTSAQDIACPATWTPVTVASVAPVTKSWKPTPMSRAVASTSSTDRLTTVRRLRRIAVSEESRAAL